MIAVKDTELFSERDWTRLKEQLDLPPRQAEVLRRVMGGLSDKQIAYATGISVNTVRTHMSRLFSKFGARDRVELIVYMFGHLQKHPRLQNPAPAPGTSVGSIRYPAARGANSRSAGSER